MDHLTRTITIGVIATAVMDLWGMARQPLFGQEPQIREIDTAIVVEVAGRTIRAPGQAPEQHQCQ